MDRRDFLKGLTLLSSATCVPSFLVGSIEALGSSSRSRRTERVLVLVELAGGCDGLNTVIPYGDGAYFRARPSLAVERRKVLKVDDRLGFHPSLLGLKELFDRGELAVVRGVGYPNPNRSHFEALHVWRTGTADGAMTGGWVPRFLNRKRPHGMQGIHCEKEGLQGMGLDYLSRTSFAGRPLNADTLAGGRKYSSRVDYPETDFASKLRTAVQVLASGVDVKVFYARAGGFDTHVDQVLQEDHALGPHAHALATVSSGIKAFCDDLRKLGKAKDVLVVTFSEFGRRLKENATVGTDHGTANTMFLIGGGVKPGFYGEDPGLEEPQLDELGDLVHTVDFRTVYSTVLVRWLGADPVAVLGESWPLLSCL